MGSDGHQEALFCMTNIYEYLRIFMNIYEYLPISTDVIFRRNYKSVGNHASVHFAVQSSCPSQSVQGSAVQCNPTHTVRAACGFIPTQKCWAMQIFEEIPTGKRFVLVKGQFEHVWAVCSRIRHSTAETDRGRCGGSDFRGMSELWFVNVTGIYVSCV